MNTQHTQTLPAAARRRLVLISLGWALVALAEATAYTVLALAIAKHQPPGMVIATAAVALLSPCSSRAAATSPGQGWPEISSKELARPSPSTPNSRGSPRRTELFAAEGVDAERGVGASVPG